MDQDQPAESTAQTVIFAYTKSADEPNTVLFADDPKRDEILSLFVDPYQEMTKIPYDGKSLLNTDECFEVNLSHNSLETIDGQFVTLRSQVSGVSDYDPEEQISPIRAMYTFDGNKLIFKRIAKSQQLRDSKIISLDGEPKVTPNINVMAIDDKVDAVYDTRTHKFYFTDFQAAKAVFGTLEVYYRSATQNEIDEWLDPSLFDIDSSFDTFAISVPNRKKMLFASDELGVDLANEETLGRIHGYAALHAPKMLFINNKFNIKKNADITEALTIITGAYYQNAITGDLMIAGSSKKAGSK
jgi:hypothetical protein